MPFVTKYDAFSPALLASEVLAVSGEQQDYIRRILDRSCSDSRFAEKAYIAIQKVLTGGNVIPPVVDSLDPASVVLGSPSFTVRVLGSGFLPDSVIVFAGVDEPTTFVSENEVTTGVNMDVWAGPATLPVAVRNADGVQSDPAIFTFESAPELLSVSGSKKKPEHVVPVTTSLKK